MQPQLRLREGALDVHHLPHPGRRERLRVGEAGLLGVAALMSFADVAKFCLGLQELFFNIRRPDGHQSHPPWTVVQPEIFLQRVHWIFTIGMWGFVQCLCVSSVKAAFRTLRISQRIQHLENASLWILHILCMLAVNGLHLFRNILRIEQGSTEEVCKAIQALLRRSTRHLGKVNSHLVRSVCIVGATVRAHEIVKTTRFWVLFCAKEQHVLAEVGQTRPALGVGERARLYGNCERILQTPLVLHVQDPEAVV
mmetsp:Transcript_23266/g.42367  ORF Transcript_23266/g.42367 Transcript_23266/m.42367 type:complete len:253 (+) Transcript_23266:1443-2201(+)